ncbi:MAG: hypothetical protein WEA61_07985 [Anaerolineales bacterium]
MDFSMYGKWAWLIALIVLVVMSLLGAFSVDLGADTSDLIASIAVVLAILGGIFYLAGMKDRTGFFITVLTLAAVSVGAASFDLWGIGQYLWAILAGAAVAAVAGAAGVLLVVVYEWIMAATK